MYMYHGTNKTNGSLILQEQKIKCDSERIYENIPHSMLNTTNGYVYVDKNIYRALFFAVNAALYKEELDEDIYVFKIDTCGLEVLPDEDEKGIDDAWGDNKYSSNSFRIPTDIIFSTCNVEYLKIDYKNNRNLINELKQHADLIYFEKYKTEMQKEIFDKMVMNFEETFKWVKQSKA